MQNLMDVLAREYKRGFHHAARDIARVIALHGKDAAVDKATAVYDSFTETDLQDPETRGYAEGILSAF